MESKLFNPSPAMKIHLSQLCFIDSEIGDTTVKRNWEQAAGYEETVLHIMAHYSKGDEFSRWRTDSGKWIDSTILERLTTEKLLTKKAGKRNMYSSPKWFRNF